jgi:hypothetical protein
MPPGSDGEILPMSNTMPPGRSGRQEVKATRLLAASLPPFLQQGILGLLCSSCPRTASLTFSRSLARTRPR